MTILMIGRPGRASYSAILCPSIWFFLEWHVYRQEIIIDHSISVLSIQMISKNSWDAHNNFQTIFIWDHTMKNQMENPPLGQITLDGDMAEHPYWVRGFMEKNKGFMI